MIITPKSSNNPLSGQTFYYCEGNDCNPTTEVTGNLTLTESNTLCFQSKTGSNIMSDKVCYDANIHKQETIPVNVSKSSTIYSSNEWYWGWRWGYSLSTANRSNVCVDLTDVQTLELSVRVNANASSDHGNAWIIFSGSAGVYSDSDTFDMGSFTGFNVRYGAYSPANLTVSLKKDVSALKGNYCFYVTNYLVATHDYTQNATRSSGTATIQTATLYY